MRLTRGLDIFPMRNMRNNLRRVAGVAISCRIKTPLTFQGVCLSRVGIVVKFAQNFICFAVNVAGLNRMKLTMSILGIGGWSSVRNARVKILGGITNGGLERPAFFWWATVTEKCQSILDTCCPLWYMLNREKEPYAETSRMCRVWGHLLPGRGIP